MEEPTSGGEAPATDAEPASPERDAATESAAPEDSATPEDGAAEVGEPAPSGSAADASPLESAPAESSAPPAEADEEPAPDDDEAWEDDEAWDDDDEAWDDDYDPLRDSPDAVQSQRRIAGGAVLIGLGTLTSLGALGMGLSDPCSSPAGNSCSSSARNRAALTMGLPGLAVIGAGVAVLIVGVRQRDRLRVDAQASRTGAGLRLSGRF